MDEVITFQYGDILNPLAQVLSRLGYAYKATDYSECDFKLYVRGLKLLEKYQLSFAQQEIEAIYAEAQ